MGDPIRPQAVKLFTGVLASHEDILAPVKRRLEEKFGTIDYESSSFPFDLTNYYEQEMGSGIARYFWSFERLIDPGFLPEIKLFTNNVELEFADDKQHRSINLDPGYLDFYKMVLASVKERAQKIYMDKGIYADPTLYYLKGCWYPYDWSLPDFRPETYHEVFHEIRRLYRDNMRVFEPDSIDYKGGM